MNVRELLGLQVELVEMLGAGQPLARAVNALADSQDVSREGVSHSMAQHVLNARVFHVEKNMTPVITNRAANLERIPSWSRFGDDHVPPRTCGFVVLDEPVGFPEMRGRWQLAHMLTWGPVLAGVRGRDKKVHGWLVSFWNDIYREPDEVSKELLAEYPTETRIFRRWQCITTQFIPHGGVVGPTWMPITAERKLQAEEEFPGDPPVTEQEVPNMSRVIAALWQLLSEETAQVRHDVPHSDRPSRRFAERARVDTDVTVVTLRREAQPVEHPGTGKPLDHQVWVIEHWRTYWVKDHEKGILVPEKRKVAGHIRGPHGTPLVVKKRIENLAR